MDTLRERIKEYINKNELTKNQLAIQSKIDPSNFNKMLDGDQKITKKTIEKILLAYPDINRTWLLTGEGEMLKQPLDDGRKYKIDEIEIPTKKEVDDLQRAIHEGRARMIPLVHIDSVGGVWSQNSITSSEQYTERLIPFESARPGDVAIMQSGDSMSPTIPSGAIMQIRKVEDWQEYFGYDNVYVLWLRDDRRITKLVRKYPEDPKNYILCCSYNPESADEELPRRFIREVWKVVNVLIPKGW